MPELYLDSDVSVHIAPLLVSGGHPTRTARDEGRLAATDYEQLAYAAQRGWAIITHNKKDDRLLHGARQYWGRIWGAWRPHAGIVILEQVSPEQLARALLILLEPGVQLSNKVHEWTRAQGWSPSRPGSRQPHCARSRACTGEQTPPIYRSPLTRSKTLAPGPSYTVR